VIGGSTASSSLTLRSTSGVGTTGADIIFQAGNNGATEVMRLQNGGNVGIGTSSPGAKLTVSAGDAASATNQFIISGGRSLGTGIGSSGSILFTNSYWNSGFGAAMVSAIDSGSAGGHIVLATLTDGGGTSGTPTEKVRILQNGYVGIGTTSPAYQTQVNGLGQTTAALTDAGNKGGSILIADLGAAAGNGGALLFAASVTNGYVPGCAIKSLLTNGSANGQSDLAFSTRNAVSDTSLTERMRITFGGNVGIGTPSPDALLTVNTIASFGDGAVTTPSIAHKGDLNTGFWFPAADVIAASTAGSERVRIDSSGNVGIGTGSTIRSILNTNVGTVTGPAVTAGLTLSANYSGVTAVNSIDWNYSGQTASPVRLGATFNSDGNGMEMVFYTSTAFNATGSERMRLDKDGRLAIGTSTPATSARLEIAGTTGALLVPRLTTAQRDALTAVNGMIIYNTTTNTMQGRINGAWADM
jgi:hypothetical protein